MRWLSLVACLLGCGPAAAGCAVEGRGVEFGDVQAARRTLGTGEVRVRCDAPGRFEVGLGGGSGGRELRGPDGARLRYGLYQDPGRNVGWGDGGPAGPTRVASTDDRGAADLFVYGLIPVQPGVPPGTYDDQLQIILVF